MQQQTLSIALSSESLGLAIFQGQHLMHLEAYWLHAVPKAAETSRGHLLRSIETFDPTIAIVQPHSGPPDVQAAIVEALRSASRPVVEVEEEDVMRSFGEPQIQDKNQLHQLVRALFPQIPSTRLVLSCLDAVAAGLYFETRRLLELDSPG